MRKRAYTKKTISYETKHVSTKKTFTEKKPSFSERNWWIAAALIGIFILTLFLNTYFNLSSGTVINPEGKTLSERFYLSGPDPYYNMRLVENIIKTGQYPFYSSPDPILNYPVGRSGGRPPLLSMLAIGFSRLLLPFMDETNAIGYSMQFVPALFGALLVFPVYIIGEMLFGRKTGLTAALFVPLIPIHIASGHGSAYSLFDHDSLNLLLFFIIFLFLIKSLKEEDIWRSLLYALLSGVALGALSLTWVEADFIYVVVAIYAVVQMLIDIFTSKIELKVARNTLAVLAMGYLIYFPLRIAKIGGFKIDVFLFSWLLVAALGVIYLFLSRKRIPWVISLPSIFCIAGITLVFLYFVRYLSSYITFLSPLSKLANVLYGKGIYGNKVSQTIAEAGTYSISRTVMSYGPILYWLAWAGFFLLIYFYFRSHRREYLFFIILFLIEMWLTSVAGRFLNDLVPIVALLGGWTVWLVIDKIDYRRMLRNIRGAGGGFRGLRKGVDVIHVFGILFVLLILLSNSVLALDAAVPGVKKQAIFGKNYSGAFGLTSYKEQYWVDALSWLSIQDSDIPDHVKRPAFISWWDYGFYESAVGGHPTVADNFQSGIPPAANFHTATSEKEATAVLIIRLLEGAAKHNDGKISSDIADVLERYVGKNNTVNITTWIEEPTTAPSYMAPIGEEYDEELSKRYKVGEQWPENAFYHDITSLLLKLDDENITWLYHEIQNVTGYSIRYYGVEGYDKQIFNIFAFLADKSIVLPAFKSGGMKLSNPEDDFIKVRYVGYRLDPDGSKTNGEWAASELNDMPRDERSRIVITDTKTEYKPAYYKTMFFRAYMGNSPSRDNLQLPCWGMKHFYAEYISDISKYPYFRGTSAVVIAKYYEGAYINGTVTFMDQPVNAQVVIQKNITHYGTNIPIDHDKTNTTIDGYFSLIAPAGNITLQIRRYPELGINAFQLKNVTFDSKDDPELAPISDDEAMRRPGTNYRRTLNITISPSHIEGYVYINKDNNETYNASSDEPIPHANITLIEIEEFDPKTGGINQTGTIQRFTTDENGHYNTSSDLMPGIYLIRATFNDFVIHESYIRVHPGNNSYNISKPKPSSVQGYVYYDSNNNDEYDAGEEMNGVNITLFYEKPDGKRKQVAVLTTNKTGEYHFQQLIPGKYVVNATKINLTTKNLDYETEEEITLEENQTTTFNISLKLASVTVKGYTKYENKAIKEISILFLPDKNTKNNTAIRKTAKSNETGYYQVKLIPGVYNISVDERGKQGIYSFHDQLITHLGEGTRYLDITLTKMSVTVSGNTTYENKSIGNITIKFIPDLSVKNNTAEY
ncbi:MAG: hypothetical protein DRN08_00325, partial [Thermoplasmata archaeon]